MVSQPAPDRSGSLSRESVVDAALALVQDEGVDALSMRRLAARLGAAVTSIYWHVGNRDTLVDELVDRILDQMGTIEATGTDPISRVVSLAVELHTRLLDRPYVLALAHERGRSRFALRPARLALAGEFSAAGLAPDAAAVATQAVELYVLASTMLERTVRTTADQEAAPPYETTGLPDALVQRLAAPADHQVVFERGLRAMVTGLLGGKATFIDS